MKNFFYAIYLPTLLQLNKLILLNIIIRGISIFLNNSDKSTFLCLLSVENVKLAEIVQINYTYQISICAIGVTVWIWRVNSQGHTVSKNCQQYQVLKWSERNLVKETLNIYYWHMNKN